MKAGYRSDKWKWVLSLSPSASPADTTSASDDPDPAPVTASVVADAGENGLKKNDSHCEVKTSKGQQKNGATDNHAKPPLVCSEGQLTNEHILKTYGMDRWPKLIPCPYVIY